MTKLTVRPSTVCGRQLFHPIDENAAVQLRKVTKTMTLTREQISGLKYFGFEFEIEQPIYEI